MRLVLLHEKDIILNKDKLKDILSQRGLTFISVFEKMKEKYGIDIEYKGFMNLIDNRSSWKLLYAYALIDVLSLDSSDKMSIDDLFTVIDVDIDKKIQQKKDWNKKYGKSTDNKD